MRRSLLILALTICALVAHAQSNLLYDLRVLADRRMELLDSFPRPFVAEKINVQLSEGQYALTHEIDNCEEYDFVVAASDAEASCWSVSFDSIWSFTTEEGQFTVWKNARVEKNKQKKVLRENAYNAFVEYIESKTAAESIWPKVLGFSAAGVILLMLVGYAIYIMVRNRKERGLTPVQRETLRRKRESGRRHIFSQSYLWLLLLILYAPIILIVVFSFTESKVLGNWTGFSGQLYLNLFSGKGGAALNSAIMYTVLIALIAAFCSTLLGTLAAIGIYNMRAKQRKVVSFLNSVPMINPDIITGISLFLLFVALGVSQGLTTVCIAHIVFCTPYVVLSVMPRLSRMNPNTYEAALDLGATPFQALRKVLMPELWPGMISGFVLALTLSVDDFGVTFFTKGSGGLETLSTFIYSDARKGGLTPELRPLFSLILIVMLTVLVVMNVRADRKARETKR